MVKHDRKVKRCFRENCIVSKVNDGANNHLIGLHFQCNRRNLLFQLEASLVRQESQRHHGEVSHRSWTRTVELRKWKYVSVLD